MELSSRVSVLRHLAQFYLSFFSQNTSENANVIFNSKKFVKPYSLPRSSSEQPNAPAPSDFKPSFLDSAPTSSATSAGIETFSSNTTAQLPAPLAIEFMADLYLEKAFEAKESDRSAAENYIKQSNQVSFLRLIYTFGI
ncbi:hypothetical protein FRC02_006661 [Tulasnella sp. 418]|nr:hypothetical protein FRC02_006661 [Tulasnella sp. 418]